MIKEVGVDYPPITTVIKKVRVVAPSPNGYIYKTLPFLRLREHYRREKQTYCKSQKIGEFVVKLFLIVTSKDTIVKSYQHDYPNLS